MKKEYIDQLNSEAKGFIKTHELKVVDYKDNQCISEAPLLECSLNPYGIAHGGFIYGLMDTCGALHIFFETKKRVVTTNSNVNFIKPCKGSKVVAKTKAIKIGKNICVIEVNAYNDKDELLTTGVFNYYYID